MTEFVVGLLIFVFLLLVGLTNKSDLKRYQELKNKRRFSGKRLSPNELADFEKLQRKYPMY